MNSSSVTHDLPHDDDDDDIVVLKVVKPNVVTPNKSVETSNGCITNMPPKYDNSWTDYKRTCNIAFPYHGDNTFAAAAYGSDPTVELLQNTESSSKCN